MLIEAIDGPPDAPIRSPLPDTRGSITHHFEIMGAVEVDGRTVPITTDGYVTVGLYEDGRPGEVFVALGKIGNSVAALLDAWCAMVSIHLQCGGDLDDVVAKFRGWQFEPSGMTNTEGIRECASPLDYVAKWLGQRFGETEDL